MTFKRKTKYELKDTLIYNLKAIRYFILFLLEFTGFIDPFKDIKIISDESKVKMKSARWFFFREHLAIGQRYGKDNPYFFHLEEVATLALEYSLMIGLSESEIVDMYIIALGHDLLEDHHSYTYNDVKDIFGTKIANSIYTLSELRGKNRAERHSIEYLKGFREDFSAAFIKLCDIHSNVSRGIKEGSSMSKKYKKEWKVNKEYFDDERLVFLVTKLEEIFKRV